MHHSESLTRSIGVGLRPTHYNNWLDGSGKSLWIEAISENYMFSRGRPLEILTMLRQSHEVALHGVSMSIGSARDGFSEYLKALRDLIVLIEPWIVSDHFCWTGLGNHNAFDLLPMPFTNEAIKLIVNNIDRVQSHLNRQIYFENISAYIGFMESDLSEVQFINEIIDRSGCGLLLDVNNVFVNAHNFGFSAFDYIDAIHPKSVGEIHLAGHSLVDQFLFDSHDAPVAEGVWDLYRYAVKKIGKIPTMIEWDDSIPDLPVVLDECQKADQILNGGRYGVSLSTEHTEQFA